MAVTRTAKCLAEPTALSTTMTQIKAAGAAEVIQITGCILTNNGASTRNISLELGTAGKMFIQQIRLTEYQSYIFPPDSMPWVLENNKVFRAKQDIGTDVNITLFGVSEVNN